MALPSSFNILQDVILRLGAEENTPGFQDFQKADHTTDLRVLEALQRCNQFSLPALKRYIDRVTHDTTQAVDVRVLANMGGTITTNLAQGGTGSFNSFEEFTVPVNTGSVVAYKFVISAADIRLLDYISARPDEKFRMLLGHGMRQGVEKVLDQINTDAITFLDALKAPNGGRGTLPDDGADNKELDLSTDDNPYLTLYEEMRANRFGNTNRKLVPTNPDNDVNKPILLGTPGLWTNEQSLMQFGQNNERNAKMQLPILDMIDTNSMALVDPLTDSAYAYMIDKRAVAFGTRESKWIKDNWSAKHLNYIPFQVSTLYPDLALPDVTMVAYMSQGEESTFATYNEPEAYLDQVTKVTIYTFPYFINAPATTPDRTGVVAYRFLT